MFSLWPWVTSHACTDYHYSNEPKEHTAVIETLLCATSFSIILDDTFLVSGLCEIDFLSSQLIDTAVLFFGSQVLQYGLQAAFRQ